MKIKVSAATNTQLDWLVAKCETKEFFDWQADPTNNTFSPSIDWAQGGPIIEREKLVIAYEYGLAKWQAYIQGEGAMYYGPTPLIAAMRCFVASKLGDEVEVEAGHNDPPQ